jgi:hypothetical protein
VRDKHSRARFGSKAVCRSLAVIVKQTSRRARVPGEISCPNQGWIGGRQGAGAQGSRTKQTGGSPRRLSVDGKDGEQRARVCDGEVSASINGRW